MKRAERSAKNFRRKFLAAGRRAFGLALAPAPLWAEVCDKVRPAWDGVPMTATAEALRFWTSVHGFELLAMTILVLVLRRPWLMGAVAMIAFVHVALGFIPKGEIHQAALREGCIGSPALLRLSLALLIALLLWQGHRTSRHRP